MKIIYLLTSLLITSNLFGQIKEPNLYETSKASKKVYTDNHKDFILAYQMGKYLDKAGTGSAILKADTLTKQSDHNYLGKEFKIEMINNQLYITSLTKKKSKKYELNSVENYEAVHRKLNNAYYLDNYFAMSKRLNNKYELNHFSFRNGFYGWEKVSKKTQNYIAFKKIVDIKIKQIEDSISKKQDLLVSQTTYLINNIDNLSYAEFNAKLAKIPAEFASQSSYYKTVINKISKKKYDYVVALYKDYPENRTLIEFAVEKNNSLLQILKAMKKKDLKVARKKK